ncbi:MACPF domain-containing protein At4g24290-like [Phragmites australis]|uniref:MACPF domain-containing protein At4g24290-like n=1 Tax=Phragmites australis TaxID=29695 RepID=UPI002D7A2067|nr:MACPF domain-containing protein At4g24290-like [Phragmites australis]XP_062208140.1 MACPF domain-containing protein At4g24290-like [Phragmites australis]XP_062208141.1 MACPF domain-containing protein At4g24290-like [Phragmites australis]XP_062208142.1 MACPF domain-containing protein At4g24290-like [Phragmites australis]
MAHKSRLQSTAESAIRSIGLGFDVANDIRLKYCKQRNSPDPLLIELDHGEVQDIVLPGGLTVASVPKSIKCDKGERMRFRSDVLSFQQMSEQFNQELSLSGKIPSGLFNNMFEFTGCWQKDAANTKSLAFDGWCITLYTVALSKAQIVLQDHVKQAVPSTWEPAALARFIKKFGTHIVVGLKMGGKDVIYLKQQHSSSLQAVDVQKRLKEMSDRRFLKACGQYDLNFKDTYGKNKSDTREQQLRFLESSSLNSYSSTEDLVMMPKRRGGRDKDFISHSEWLNTVQAEPDVISMSFIPITSLLNGVPGSGFLNHAINLYLRYKPPIEELHQFLEFQLPRQWAPIHSDLPLGPQRKRQSSASLPVNLIGPKLYVCTNMVDVGKRPVTGLRLFLEGRKSNKLAIHLQHLCSLPQIIQLQDDPYNHQTPEAYDRKYYEPFGPWKHFSHVCTAPIESDDDLSIVTGAQLDVVNHGFKKVLFFRLHFSKACNAILVKNPEWENSPNLAQKSGLISTLISTHFSTVAQKPPPRPADVNINSAVYPGGPPVPVQTPKLLRFVDTTEMMRGPQDSPGYWVVSGAKLNLERGKISLRVKYSLLTAMLPDDEFSLDDEC